MREVINTYGVRMQFDATQIYDPCESRSLIDHDFFRSASRRKRKRHCSHPLRVLRRRALLIKRLTFGAVDETLENQWAILNSADCASRNRQVVTHDIELREFGLLRKVKLVRVRHTDFVSVDQQHLRVVFLHEERLAEVPSKREATGTTCFWKEC